MPERLDKEKPNTSSSEFLVVEQKKRASEEGGNQNRKKDGPAGSLVCRKSFSYVTAKLLVQIFTHHARNSSVLHVHHPQVAKPIQSR